MGLDIRGTVAAFTRWLDGQGWDTREPLEIGQWQTFDESAVVAAVPSDVADRAPAQRRIDRRRLATAFDAAHPVKARVDLFGRERELDQLLSAVLDFRQHTIVHGARGSGKTSLVRVLGDHADEAGVVVIYLACEPHVSFAQLLRPYLLSIPPAALAMDQRSGFQRKVAELPADFGPRAFVDLVADSVTIPALFIFDEFDRIEDEVVKSDIAAAMKLLSDSLAQVLFMIVGIARSVSDVVGAHPSLRRHMRTVSIGRITPTSVDALIDFGQLAAGLHFTPAARVLIGRAACGSPYHVRMFCHHAALASAANESTEVTDIDVRDGLLSAFESWSQMNEPDARLFAAAATNREVGVRINLEKLAGVAALDDAVRIEPDHAAAGALVRDALQPLPADPELMTFRDSLAPQFLIALLITIEQAGKPAQDLTLEERSHVASR